MRGAGVATRALLVLPVLVLSLGAALRAQQATATLVGHVLDARTQQALPNAAVLVAGTLLRARTDARGDYRIDDVAPGRYELRVLIIGYQSETRAVRVAAGDTARADFSLQHALIELTPVTITASREERRIGDVPASQAVLSSQSIVNRNVITLDQALQYVPGVILNHGDIDVRGSTGIAAGIGSRVLFLVDGHPVLTADGGEVDFASLPLLDVDRVEVVKGAYSALYGSSALGGVVNVITNPVSASPESEIELHYGAYNPPGAYRVADHRQDFKGVALQHDQTVGGLGVRLFANRELNDGYTQDDSSSRWLLHSRVDFSTGHDHPASAYATWSSENVGNFFMWESPDHPYQPPLATISDWSHNTKLSAGATLAPIATGRSRLRVDPYFEQDATQDHFPSDSDFHFHRAWKLGTNVQYTLAPAANQTLTFGGAAAYTTVTSDILGRPTIEEYGLYGQDELDLTDRVSASLGLRLDTHRSTGSSTEVALNPKLGVVFHPASHISTRISLARGYRGPSAIEQFVNTVQFGFHVVPNPDLHGESAWSGEVGVTATPVPWLWLDAALFQSDYHDLIGPASAPGQFFVFQFRNTQRARIRGLDVSTKVRVVPRLLDVQVSYLYLDSKDLHTDLPLPYRSTHNVTTSLDVLGGLLGVDLRYRSRVKEVLTYPLDPRSAITVADLRLGYDVKGTIVQVKVANLFQAKYVDVLERTPGAPRSVLFSARRKF
ncbi:MAG: TonB-dependent receptor [Gemmatimonadaceae bacterium]